VIPPHFWILVTEFLNVQFTGMWIVWDDSILWQPANILLDTHLLVHYKLCGLSYFPF
jgi:hypothetical protein